MWYPFPSRRKATARFASFGPPEGKDREMARVCQVSGKKANNAKHIRHRHSGQWKFRAPKKNRLQLPNLKSVRIKTEHGTVTLTVATSVLKSPEFAAVLSGLKPVPKEWLKKPSYE
jgi:ribosomal protein L28